VRFQDYVGFGSLTTSVALRQHAHQHSPEYPVLLAVDQQLGEGATLRVAPELSFRSARSKSGSMRTWSSLARASGGIANGYLRLEPQEWVRAVEKRPAALGRKIDV